jgi:hypothetical protein
MLRSHCVLYAPLTALAQIAVTWQVTSVGRGVTIEGCD